MSAISFVFKLNILALYTPYLKNNITHPVPQGLGTYINGVAGPLAEYVNITHTSMTQLIVCSVTAKIGSYNFGIIWFIILV